jgi:hypothetical protein
MQIESTRVAVTAGEVGGKVVHTAHGRKEWRLLFLILSYSRRVCYVTVGSESNVNSDTVGEGAVVVGYETACTLGGTMGKYIGAHVRVSITQSGSPSVDTETHFCIIDLISLSPYVYVSSREVMNESPEDRRDRYDGEEPSPSPQPNSLRYLI